MGSSVERKVSGESRNKKTPLLSPLREIKGIMRPKPFAPSFLRWKWEGFMMMICKRSSAAVPFIPLHSENERESNIME